MGRVDGGEGRYVGLYLRVGERGAAVQASLGVPYEVDLLGARPLADLANAQRELPCALVDGKRGGIT